MRQRIITGAVLVLITAAVLALSGTWVYIAAMTALCAVGTWEMLGCVGERKTRSLSVPALLVSVIAPFLMYFFNYGAISTLTVLFLFFVLFVSVFTGESVKTPSVCVVFATTVYVYTCFSSLLKLRYVAIDGETVGQYVFVLVFVAAWVTDTFAYFTGVFFGKHKLIPRVSPKKTIEGSVGGIVFCVIAFAVYGLVIGKVTDFTPNYAGLCIIGLVLSVVSQLGDLVASAIKRSYGIKDYGSVFPGHGGVFDRFDSVMAVSPVLLMLADNPRFLQYIIK